MRPDPELITNAPPQDYHLHYALEHAPFSIQSDTSLFVLSEGHERALDKLYRALIGRKSLMLITGAPGTGKTLLLQTLMELAEDHCEFLVVHSEDLDACDLAASEPRDKSRLSSLILAATPKGQADGRTESSTTTVNEQLRDYIRKSRTSQRRPTVVIDEAQRLSDAALETLRCWSNLDNQAGTALQFILAGHNSLGDRLNSEPLTNLKQRIGMRCELPTLSLGDTQRYIAHRCLLAGATRPLFERAVIIRIYSLTGGCPRLINTVADALLLEAFLAGRRSVELQDVARVSEDLNLRYAPIVQRPDQLAPVTDSG